MIDNGIVGLKECGLQTQLLSNKWNTKIHVPYRTNEGKSVKYRS
jgi:hypothetical protein